MVINKELHQTTSSYRTYCIIPSTYTTVKVSCSPEKWHGRKSHIHRATKEQQHLDYSFNAKNASDLQPEKEVLQSPLVIGFFLFVWEQPHRTWKGLSTGVFPSQSTQPSLQHKLIYQKWRWLRQNETLHPQSLEVLLNDICQKHDSFRK